MPIDSRCLHRVDDNNKYRPILFGPDLGYSDPGTEGTSDARIVWGDSR